ncbi:Hypp7296 [Branchiostoma lanceolatum]|uniref:Hypp7296 protein n=1 Tax=Branchiostoma lanceolatum TaxID=7740 RepID=A0A8K0ECS8_BRALA|nr:Hypp7296 [Branchiostoma lanceolatum]
MLTADCNTTDVLFVDMAPDLVFVHVGTNNLPMHRPLSRTVEDFSSLISVANYAVQLHRQRCQAPHRFALREEVWPELEDGGRSVKDGEETAAVDQEKKRMEAAVDQEKKRMETAAVDQEKKRMETAAVDQEKKRMETAAVDQEKKRMETAAVDQEKKRMEGMGQRLGQWARVVRDGRKQQVGVGTCIKGGPRPREAPIPNPSKAPGKVVGGTVSTSKGGPRPREAPIPNPRKAPGKVVGGSVGTRSKRGSRPREAPIPNPSKAPGKVVGGSVGTRSKRGSRPREAPIPNPSKAPGKVEGGSVGTRSKRGPRPREAPIPNPRKAPGKVEGGSARKIAGSSSTGWIEQVKHEEKEEVSKAASMPNYQGNWTVRALMPNVLGQSGIDARPVQH